MPKIIPEKTHVCHEDREWEGEEAGKSVVCVLGNLFCLHLDAVSFFYTNITASEGN